MIVIALGANLFSVAGAPEKTITAALETLARRGIVPVAVSALYATAAWPDPADPPFVNAAAEIETSLAPDALMRELEFGRSCIRAHQNARQRAANARHRSARLQRPCSGTRSHAAAPSHGHARLRPHSARGHRAGVAAPRERENRGGVDRGIAGDGAHAGAFGPSLIVIPGERSAAKRG